MVSDAVKMLRADRHATAGNSSDKEFVIHIGLLPGMTVLGDQAAECSERLRQVPNYDQAYVIRPLGDRELAVAGLTDRGVFYGIQTLRQLLTARLSATEVIVPLVTITDWPDFAERGLWNSGLRSTPEDISWLASRKLNFEHMNHPVDLRPSKETCPPLPVDLLAHARDHAFHLMPHCWHYDFWNEDAAMREHFPDLLGKGESARNPWSIDRAPYHPEARCPCASNPQLREALVAWLCSAAQQGVREASLWLSEYQPCSCSCPECSADGLHQLVRETRVSIEAIQEARREFPDLIGRLFLTYNVVSPEEERACRESIALATTEGSVRVECVYSLQEPFDRYAREGHWVANYSIGPPLGASWRSRGAARMRFTPHPVELRQRLADLHNARYAAVYNASSVMAGCLEKGIVERHLSDFHLAMLSEWCWNSGGRDVNELAVAWLRQRGCDRPNEVLPWLLELVRSERAILPACDELPTMIVAIGRGETLQLGHEPGLMEFSVSDTFTELMDAAARCAAAFTDFGQPDLAAEARCMEATLGVHQGLCHVSRATSFEPAERVSSLDAAIQVIDNHIASIRSASADQTKSWPDLPEPIAASLNEATDSYWKKHKQALLAALGR
jgi:hypothetical protein